MPRKSPKESAAKRVGFEPEDFRRRKNARLIASSRIGEIQRAEGNLEKRVGMGDVKMAELIAQKREEGKAYRRKFNRATARRVST